jgi:integrase
MAAKLERWVAVMQGRGRRRHRGVAFRTIYNYLGYALPALQDWQQRVMSLREITRDDVAAAVRALRGEDAHHLMVALHSIFRALKQERVIFANPCSGISVTRAEPLPTSVPSDQLAGLIDRVRGSLARLAAALAAVHAVQPGELRRLTTADLDLPCGRMTIRRDTGRRVLYLDRLTLRCLQEWLRERYARWPRSPNPHLLVSQQTAAHTTPVGSRFIADLFVPTGITPMKLRRDRILDEARLTADPVRLMRLFGISDTTAMKYVFTAHPDRQSVPGR